jgi:hypothetical protein
LPHIRAHTHTHTGAELSCSGRGCVCVCVCVCGGGGGGSMHEIVARSLLHGEKREKSCTKAGNVFQGPQSVRSLCFKTLWLDYHLHPGCDAQKIQLQIFLASRSRLRVPSILCTKRKRKSFQFPPSQTFLSYCNWFIPNFRAWYSVWFLSSVCRIFGIQYHKANQPTVCFAAQRKFELNTQGCFKLQSFNDKITCSVLADGGLEKLPVRVTGFMETPSEDRQITEFTPKI